MTNRWRRLGLPLLGAVAILVLSITPAFAQADYWSGSGGYMSGGYMSSSGSMPAYHAPAYHMPAYHAPYASHYGVTTYVVQPGDTLAHIAAHFGVSTHALLHANPSIEDPDLIFIGQTLVIPTGAVVYSNHYHSGGYAHGGYAAPPAHSYSYPPSSAQPYAQPPAMMMPGYGAPAAPPQGYQQPMMPPYSAPPMNTQPPPAAPPPAAPPPAAPPAQGSQAITINLIAHNLAFNMAGVTVPAGAQVTVNFDNQDAGVPHNFAVYTDSTAQQAIFRGQIVTGPAMTTYTFMAPSQPGTYFFRCDVHFMMMTGQFVVQ